MSHHVIDIHHETHTCPNGPEPHIVHSRRTLVSTQPGGPCTRPVTITCGDTAVPVACGRALPSAQQCGACRVTITIRHTTTTHLGEVATSTGDAVPSGLLKDPCPTCGKPVAALLGDTGRHLLCPPPDGAR